MSIHKAIVIAVKAVLFASKITTQLVGMLEPYDS